MIKEMYICVPFLLLFIKNWEHKSSELKDGQN